MGRPFPLVVALAWHISGLLGGSFVGQVWTKTATNREALRESARAAAEAAAERCASLVNQQCLEGATPEGKKAEKKGSNRAESSGTGISYHIGFLVALVSVGSWLIGACCGIGCGRCRRSPTPTDTASEDSVASPLSREDRRELALQQLSQVRRRRHGAA